MTAPTGPPSIATETLQIDGRNLPAQVFRYSRKKEVFGLLFMLAMAAAGPFMYLDAESASWPVIGVAPAFTRVFAILATPIMLAFAVPFARRLFRPQQYVAFTPDYLVIFNGDALFPIPWEQVEDLGIFLDNGHRRLGFRVREPESLPALRPALKRMAATRAYSKWDWTFGLQLFDEKPQQVETAVRDRFASPNRAALFD